MTPAVTVCGAYFGKDIDLKVNGVWRSVTCTLPPDHDGNHEDHSEGDRGGDVLIWRRVPTS